MVVSPDNRPSTMHGMADSHSGTSPGPPKRSLESSPTRLTALPSVGARVFAFICIAVAGAAGAIIGYAFVDLQCRGNCTIQTGLATFVGGAGAAIGTSVVVVLTMRAMGEWKTIKSTGQAPIGDTDTAGETVAERQPRVR